MTSAKVTFVNNRVRMQRLSDAKLFSGWVSSISKRHAIVQVSTILEVSAGDRFRFEVVGKGATALFEGRLEMASGTILVFGVTTSIRAFPSKEDARARTRCLSALVYRLAGSESKEISGDAIEAQVVDISANGVGLLSQIQFAKGDRLHLEIDQARARCEGEVRYCRSEEVGFRIGIRITQTDRLSQGVIESVIQQSAA